MGSGGNGLRWLAYPLIYLSLYLSFFLLFLFFLRGKEIGREERRGYPIAKTFFKKKNNMGNHNMGNQWKKFRTFKNFINIRDITPIQVLELFTPSSLGILYSPSPSSWSCSYCSSCSSSSQSSSFLSLFWLEAKKTRKYESSTENLLFQITINKWDNTNEMKRH